jgi:hypothetical protein
VKSIVKAFWLAEPYKLGIPVFFYFLVMIGITDGVIWYSAGTLGGMSWKELTLYSVLSYPLWMLLGSKGIAREQTDTLEQSRWFALDLLPARPTYVAMGHFLGKTFKTRALGLWFFIYFSLTLFRGVQMTTLLLAIAGILLGSYILCLGGWVFRLMAPKGYSHVFGATYYSLTWILSGAVFPLTFLTKSPFFYILNPYSSIITTPLMLVIHPTAPDQSQVLISSILGVLVWIIVLDRIGAVLERKRRAYFYQ